MCQESVRKMLLGANKVLLGVRHEGVNWCLKVLIGVRKVLLRVRELILVVRKALGRWY